MADQKSVGQYIEEYMISKEHKRSLRIYSNMDDDSDEGLLLRKEYLGAIKTEDVNRLEHCVSFYVWTTKEEYESNLKKLQKHFSDTIDEYDGQIIKIRRAFSKMMLENSYAEDF